MNALTCHQSDIFSVEFGSNENHSIHLFLRFVYFPKIGKNAIRLKSNVKKIPLLKSFLQVHENIKNLTLMIKLCMIIYRY